MTTPTNPPPYDYNWGVPNISVPIPASRDEIPLTPKPLGEVEFTPVGIYDVRRNLGAAVPHFNRLRHRYAAADLAFVASGASEDGHHQTAPTEFFPEFWSLYDSQPMGRPGQLARKDFGERCRRSLFDLVHIFSLLFLGDTLSLRCYRLPSGIELRQGRHSLSTSMALWFPARLRPLSA